MNNTRVPVLKDLVLVGGGHSHVIVLKKFGMNPMPGLRLTVVARDILTPYSGMLPGLVAGHYEHDEVHIDLSRLARFAGARLYHDEAIGLDLVQRHILCRNRPPVSYDVVSVDIGVTPAQKIAGAANYAVPVKPISNFVDRWASLRERVRSESKLLRVGVVGAGAAGVELTLAIQHAVENERVLNGLGGEIRFYLFSTSATVLPSHNRIVQKKFKRVLTERGVNLCFGCRVVEVRSNGLLTDDGAWHELDEIVWATEAGAPAWPRKSGLEVDHKGFIRVNDTLQSTSEESVFAVGDIASVVNHPREKAGVFAVRQGPPLANNLRRFLTGRPLQSFAPQKRFLSLISTGDRRAIASRGIWSLEGKWVWHWKNLLDKRFMKSFSDLPKMESTAFEVNDAVPGLADTDVVKELSASAMRCGGCGSKVGATVLERVLPRLKTISQEDVVLGLDFPDDASVERVPEGMVALRTVDVFRPIIDDPYRFGQITATHCLGDIYAMGADPRTALAIATVPLGPDVKMEQLLEELLTGVVEVLNNAGVALTGGHTNEGNEIELGLAISGVADPKLLLRKGGMHPGDCLILTKPIGTGTLFAAEMQCQARGNWIDEAIAAMIQSSKDAGICLREHGATACTDVTGFGLVGHLLEMVRASGVDATISLDAVPILTGAEETAAAGFLSSLQPQNIRLRRAVSNHVSVSSSPKYPLLFDPQTAGGLLASVPSSSVEGCLSSLIKLGYEKATVIGTVSRKEEEDAPIRVEL